MNIFFVSICCVLFCYASQSAFAQNATRMDNTSNSGQFGTCQQLQSSAAELQLNSIHFFSKEKSPIFISICRDAAPRVFEQFFAYLHTSKSNSQIVPKAGINRIRTVIKPDHKVFATGVVALKQETLQQETLQQETLQQEPLQQEPDIYQLRIRVRINDGDFTDLVVDITAQEGQVTTANYKGFSIALAKP